MIHFDLFTFEGFKNALLLPTVVPMGTYHLMRFDSPNAHVLRGRTSRHVLETHGAVFFDSHAAARYDNSLFGYPVAITLGVFSPGAVAVRSGERQACRRRGHTHAHS